MFMLRYLSAVWGIVGVAGMLFFAIYRIFHAMLSALSVEIIWFHWLALIVSVVFMAYSEGYKGFQQNFSPRVAARILYLSREANCLNGLLAPLFCMGYFGTTRRRQMTSILLTCMLIVLVLLVRQMPQPWRGIIDAGVIVGLLWGVISLLVYVWLAFSCKHFPYSPELPVQKALAPE